MRDVVFLSLAVGFFVVATAYVRACAAIAGSDTDPEAHVDDRDPDRSGAAT
jgi:hypothetical protein